VAISCKGQEGPSCILLFLFFSSYQRLNEARTLWGRAVFLTREIAQSIATTLLFDDDLPKKETARDAAATSCRYLAAFS